MLRILLCAIPNSTPHGTHSLQHRHHALTQGKHKAQLQLTLQSNPTDAAATETAAVSTVPCAKLCGICISWGVSGVADVLMRYRSDLAVSHTRHGLTQSDWLAVWPPTSCVCSAESSWAAWGPVGQTNSGHTEMEKPSLRL